MMLLIVKNVFYFIKTSFRNRTEWSKYVSYSRQEAWKKDAGCGVVHIWRGLYCSEASGTDFSTGMHIHDRRNLVESQWRLVGWRKSDVRCQEIDKWNNGMME
jgi:hypothetical protein